MLVLKMGGRPWNVLHLVYLVVLLLTRRMAPPSCFSSAAWFLRHAISPPPPNSIVHVSIAFSALPLLLLSSSKEVSRHLLDLSNDKVIR